jgi:hypothetical protein
MMTGAGKSCVAIVRISVLYLTSFNRFWVTFHLEFKEADVPNSEHAVESPWISIVGDRAVVNLLSSCRSLII